jgi:hypothetical protein
MRREDKNLEYQMLNQLLVVHFQGCSSKTNKKEPK